MNGYRPTQGATKGGAYLLHGPIGCGKTTLARIFAKALLCDEQHESGSPCGRCRSCLDFDAGQNWVLLDGKKAQADQVRAATNSFRYGSLNARRTIVMCDEAHALHPQSKAIFHGVLERLPSEGVVLFCTWAVDRLDDDLLQRFKDFRVSPLADELLVEHGADVCRREGIPFERGALELLAEQASGSVRELLKHIETLQTGVTVDRVRATMRLDYLVALRGYLGVLLSGGSLAEQCRELEIWPSTPEERRQLLEKFVGYVFAREVIGRHRADKTFDEMSDQEITAFARLVASAAKAGSSDLRGFWELLINLWAPLSDDLGAAGLDARLSTFDRQLSIGRGADSPGHEPQPEKSPVRRRSAARRVRTVGDHPDSDFLSKAQVAQIWNTASFMTQEYGVLFNASASVQVARAMSHTLPRLVTHLTRGVSRFVGERLGSEGLTAHWIYVYRVDERHAAADIGLSVPDDDLLQTCEWARSRLTPRVADLGGAAQYEPLSHGRGRRIASHLKLLRRLVGGLDPSVYDWIGGERRRLLDILKVPEPMRHSAGPRLFAKRWGRSHSLSKHAIAATLPVLSAFDDRAWDWLDEGWELDEYGDRRRAKRQMEVEARELARSSAMSLFDVESSGLSGGRNPYIWPRYWQQ